MLTTESVKMMMKSLKSLVYLCCFIGISQFARADFVLSIGNGNPLAFNAGSTAIIPIFAFNSNALAPFNLTGYSIALDIGSANGGPNGVGLPSSFSNFRGNFTFGAFGAGGAEFVDSAPFQPNTYDLIAGNAGTSFQMTTSSSAPTKLFDLQFDISSGASAGTYAIVFVPGAKTGFAVPTDVNVLSGSGTAGVTTSSVSGANLNQFQITVVPEPSSLVLLTGLGAICLHRKIRRCHLQK